MVVRASGHACSHWGPGHQRSVAGYLGNRERPLHFGSRPSSSQTRLCWLKYKSGSAPGYIQGKFSIEHNREEKSKFNASSSFSKKRKKVNPKPDNQFLNLKLDRAPELVLLLGSLSSFLRAQENEEGGLSESGMAVLNKYLSP